MIFILEWFIVLIGACLVFILGDLIILMMKYRAHTDNWEYPIDLKRFREFCKNEEKNDDA